MISENEFKILQQKMAGPSLKLATITLTKGYVAIVDHSDLAFLSQWKWSASVNKSAHSMRVYAVRGERRNGTSRRIAMHRELASELGFKDVDHKDGNGLNNCRSNLRPTDRSHNNANSKKRGGVQSSKFKGVFFDRSTGRWCSQICYKKIKRHLGLFDSEMEAFLAYQRAAEEQFGEFASNF